MQYFVLILGIVFGSFVNALVWRLKSKKNWITERSVCTHCGHTLSAFDLVPIFSYLLLKGKCRYCKKRIEDSPVVELTVGIAFLLSYVFWPYAFDAMGWVRLVIWLFAVVLLAAMFIYDLRWTLLPDILTRGLLMLATIQLVILVLIGSESLSDISTYLASVLVGGGIFHLIYELSKGRYIGGGDVKLGYAYGLLLLDPLMSWMVLAVGSLIGSFIAAALIFTNKKSLKSQLPFGPMLIIGLFVVMLFGQSIWSLINTTLML